MFKLIAILALSMCTAFAQANEKDFDNADKAWSQGKPWPSHWGQIQYPYVESWNMVLLAYIRKVYDKDEASDTWLKDIPYAHQKGASVEICMMKRGLLKLATICKAALVDPTLIGTLHEEDVVALFHPRHKTKIFADGPGSDAKAAIRVFQKITSAGDDSCWERRELLFFGPVAKACFDKIDRQLIDNLLTRDFGSKTGGVNVGIDSAATVSVDGQRTGPEVKADSLEEPQLEKNDVPVQ